MNTLSPGSIGTLPYSAHKIDVTATGLRVTRNSVQKDTDPMAMDVELRILSENVCRDEIVQIFRTEAVGQEASN